MSNKNNKSTRGVMIVVPKNNQKKKKQNKTRPITRNGSAQNRQESIYAPVSIGITRRTDNRDNVFPFKRKEFVTLVNGSVNLAVKKFIVNPGDPITFRWLSQMARCFESYRLKKIKFVYVPRCSTATAGMVALSPDMNPKDSDPTDLAVALQNYRSGNDASWKAFAIDLDGEMLNKRKSFFNRPLAPDGDIDLYDTGNLFLITEGQPSTATIGQLWVEYEGVFLTPEGRAPADVSPTFITFGNNGNGVSNINPINNNLAQGQQSGDFIRSITSDGTGSVIEFAKGFHGLLNVFGQGSSSLASTPFSLDNLSGITLDQVEGTFNPNRSGRFVSSPSTGTFENLLTATTGGRLRVNWMDASNILSSTFSLTSCSL